MRAGKSERRAQKGIRNGVGPLTRRRTRSHRCLPPAAGQSLARADGQMGSAWLAGYCLLEQQQQQPRSVSKRRAGDICRR
ncbi:hypothetical protein GGF40_002882 [Coemansia sp. RSA 1286]|nr:hypothetical protein GGF40_002882 [Coemansia sp. RSA 1286]